MEEKKSKLSMAVVLLVLAIIVIIVMAVFMYKLYNDKKAETDKVAELSSKTTSLNNQISDLNAQIVELQSQIDELNQEKKSDTDIQKNNTADEKSKYTTFSKEEIEKLTQNEIISIVEVKDNLDDTVTLNLRKYIVSDPPKLTESEYKQLMTDKKIKLLDDEFVLDESGTLITNNNFTSFEVNENGELKSYNTNFFKGTDDYYSIKCSKNLKVKDLPSGDSKDIIECINDENYSDLDYKSDGYAIYKYRFNEENSLIEINITY